MDTETVITLGIASLGVLLGAASLGWQAATHVLTGGRVKTTLKVGALADSGQGMVLTPADRVTPDTLQRAAAQGYSQPIIAVEVRNVGRLAVTVSRWSIKSSHGVSYIPIGESLGPTLPHRLDAGESATWALDLGAAIQLAKTSTEVLSKNGKPAHIRGVVELADGRSFIAPERFA